MSIFLKKLISKTFFLFFLINTTYMDTDLDTDTNILVKKDSWAEWVYFHRNDILFGIFFIGLVGIVILFTDTTTSTSIINLNNLQSLTDNLFTITHKDVYTKIGEIVQKAIFKEVSSQQCIKILEKLLKEYKDYPSLVSDSARFEKIIKKLIEEIEQI